VRWQQTVVGAVLVIALIALAAFFLGRQVQTLLHLRRFPADTDEEDRRLCRQTVRRLVSSGLLLVLGFLLALALLYLEGPAQQLDDKITARQAAGQQIDLSEADRDFGRLYGWFWIGFLLILMAVVFLTAFDVWATRQFALRERRKIQADRRAMLEQQIDRLRHKDS
jgi:hypothetical protein